MDDGVEPSVVAHEVTADGSDTTGLEGKMVGELNEAGDEERSGIEDLEERRRR